MSRVVGAEGKVYALNPPGLSSLEPIAKGLDARMAAYAGKGNITRIDSANLETLEGIPDGSLDMAVLVLNYHDVPWVAGSLQKPKAFDRAKLNAAVFAKLKTGGRYIIVDHAAKEGAGAEANSIHRSDEAIVKQEVSAAGFALVESSDLLRNPDDPRDWDPNPFVCGDKCGTSDRFALRFAKP